MDGGFKGGIMEHIEVFCKHCPDGIGFTQLIYSGDVFIDCSDDHVETWRCPKCLREVDVWVKGEKTS
jgi:hypothetical protein